MASMQQSRQTAMQPTQAAWPLAAEPAAGTMDYMQHQHGAGNKDYMQQQQQGGGNQPEILYQQIRVAMTISIYYL